MRPVFDLGLKYCGGCNPTFDRVALVKIIADRLNGLVRLVPGNDSRARHVLIVAGCRSACMDTAPFAGRRVHLLSAAGDLEPMIDELMSIQEQANWPCLDGHELPLILKGSDQ